MAGNSSFAKISTTELTLHFNMRKWCLSPRITHHVRPAAWNVCPSSCTNGISFHLSAKRLRQQTSGRPIHIASISTLTEHSATGLEKERMISRALPWITYLISTRPRFSFTLLSKLTRRPIEGRLGCLKDRERNVLTEREACEAIRNCTLSNKDTTKEKVPSKH